MKEIPEMNIDPEGSDEKQPANGANDVHPGEPLPPESSETSVESALNDDLDQVPDDPDEAIAWLERLAAKQGARAEELPTVESDMPAANDMTESLESNGLADVDAGEIPEDPDEAMAWLEMMAAQEDAGTDEPVAQQVSAESDTVADQELAMIGVDDSSASPLSTDLEEALDASLPEDIDQALGWLEELTVQPEQAEPYDEGASPIDSAAPIEESPTPAVAHVVDDALAGAEVLFSEPESAEVADRAEQVEEAARDDEANDAMAWLEQLAARQGAPVEELTTGDGVPEVPATDEVPAMELDEVDLVTEDEATGVSLPSSTVPDTAGEMQEHAVQLAGQRLETDEQSEVAEQESQPALVVDPAEVSSETDLVEEDTLKQAIDERESFEAALPEQEQLELTADEEVPARDLAWLDTLGAVDAAGWLEAEATVDADESVPELAKTAEVERPLEQEPPESESRTTLRVSPDVPVSEALIEARQAMDQGEFSESLAQYELLVEKGEDLPFLIDDLEAVREQRGPEPGIQRVLGDAYARNGQLRMALESYREGLANL